jgi:hypothetical protein
MQDVRALVESRPYLSRVPEKSLIADALTGADHIVATRGNGYAFVYSPQGRRFTVEMGKLSAQRIKASRYNPRTRTASPAGDFEGSGSHQFTCPAEGFGADWVSVLDAACWMLIPSTFTARLTRADTSTLYTSWCPTNATAL